MSEETKSIRQSLVDAGINSFAADLLAESLLRSPLAAMLVEKGEPLHFFLPINRKDCAEYVGLTFELTPNLALADTEEDEQQRSSDG